MTAINPLFFSLMHQYKALCDAGQQHSEEGSDLFAEAYDLAPASFKKALHDAAVEQGLIAEKPDGYSDDGEPLYNMPDLCDRLGVDPGDVPEHLTRGAYRGNVNRAH